MTPWLWLGLVAGAALQHLTVVARRARWQRRENYRAHVQAIAMRNQLVDAARNTTLDVIISHARGRTS